VIKFLKFAVAVYCLILMSLVTDAEQISHQASLHKISQADPASPHHYTALTSSEPVANIGHQQQSPCAAAKPYSSAFRIFLSSANIDVFCHNRLSLRQFSQYSFYAAHLLSRLSCKDIIFPYHYFW
jgi:hypothetical protein